MAQVFQISLQKGSRLTTSFREASLPSATTVGIISAYMRSEALVRFVMLAWPSSFRLPDKRVAGMVQASKPVRSCRSSSLQLSQCAEDRNKKTLASKCCCCFREALPNPKKAFMGRSLLSRHEELHFCFAGALPGRHDLCCHVTCRVFPIAKLAACVVLLRGLQCISRIT